VKEFHPLILPYIIADRPTEMATRVQDAINRKNDDHFKKETKIDGLIIRNDGDNENDFRESIQESRDGNDAVRELNLRKRMIQELIQATQDDTINGNEMDIDNTRVDQMARDLSGLSKPNSAAIADHDHNVFLSFTQVVGITSMKGFLQNPRLIVNSMNNMNMHSRERGSKDGVCKMKTLQGRWFSKSVKKDDKKMKTMQIERGSIVRMFSDKTFLVFVVWRVDGSKKWFPSVIGDNPSWPVVQADLKKYRLGMREVTEHEGGEAFAYKQYDYDARNGGVEDGVNVRDSYKKVTLDDISHLCGKVDI
jgi:hypothetical protein